MGILVNQYQDQVPRAIMSPNINRRVRMTIINQTTKSEQSLHGMPQMLTTHNGQISTKWAAMHLRRLLLYAVLETRLHIGVPQERKMMHHTVAGQLELVFHPLVMRLHPLGVTPPVPDLSQRTCKA